MFFMQKNHVNLIYKLEGDFTYGVNVEYLLPMILAFTRIITESNKELKIIDSQIDFKLKPFQEGSFVIEMVLSSGTALKQLFDSITLDDITKLKELLTVIGMIGGGAAATVGGLIGLVKFVKGRPTQITPKDGKFEYANSDGQTRLIDPAIHLLFNNCNIQTAIFQGYGINSDIDIVDGVVTGLKEEPDTQVRSTKDELKSFKIYGEYMDDKTTIIEETHEHLEIAKANLLGGKFEFLLNKQRIWANIIDEDFNSRFENGKYSFRRGDAMKVLLRTKKDKTTLKPVEHTILKVSDIVHRSIQNQLE